MHHAEFVFSLQLCRAFFNSISQLLEGSPPVCGGYDSRLLSFPSARLASSFGRIYETTPLYAAAMPYDLKEPRGAWMQQSSACYPYDPSGLAYADRYDSVSRRKNATRETTNTLKAWLYEHRKNPYPTKGEKIMLAIITKMTLTQVSTWFANARRRLKKENKMTWEPRNKTSEGDDDDDSRAPLDEEDATEFLKQSDSARSKHGSSFSFEGSQQKSPPAAADSFADCFRSEEGSSSESPGPKFFKQREEKEDFASGHPPPKIWSLARTATSDSPPAVRRPVVFEDYGQPDRVFCEQLAYCKDDRRQLDDPKERQLPTGRFCDQLAYCKEEDQRQLMCLDGSSRKVEDLKEHPLSEGFCKLDGSTELKVDCELKQQQVPFYCEKNDVLKERPIYSAANECFKVSCELKQVPYYVEDVGRKSDVLLKHPQVSSSFCSKLTESGVSKHPQLVTSFCKSDECCEGELKHRQAPFYGEARKPDHPLLCPDKAMSGCPVAFCSPDRFVAKEAPCLFTKCDERACLGAPSCMLQQQTFAPDFSGGTEAYPRGTYATGSYRNEQFVPDRFDQTTSGGKGVSEDSR